MFAVVPHVVLLLLQVAAGSTSSFCTATGGMLFGWGKLKSSGDNWQAPVEPFDSADRALDLRSRLSREHRMLTTLTRS